MPSLKDRVATVRSRVPFLDHLIRTQEHVGAVKANQQAGAITYFGFISVFPILALSFAVIGFVARINPGPSMNLEARLITAINDVLPGIADGELIDTVRENAEGIASVGFVLVLYSGLGWLSAMRNALLVVFEMPTDEYPNFVLGKLRDLGSLALIGITMLLAVSVAGVVNAASTWVLAQLGLDSDLEWLLKLLAIVVGLGANTVLFFWIFRLLAQPPLPTASLWKGAFLGAFGFEVLKQAATYLLAATREQPAFQVFGIALVLVVWINYFARVLMYAAAFAHTGPQAVAQREAEAAAEEAAQVAELAEAVEEQAAVVARRETRGKVSGPFAAGAVGAATLAAMLRKRPRR
ncbi:YihY/virulence factor BrkB family protein [Nocardioides panacisoli]|uniref:YihY/virulence factor BrkB family protein n=1 Tax=Nocardioides panacisoli TaxID=627624 RepID=UPI001C635914|nr:YhjD/YihY/BrkB family envelope integrity protein [Nocardioides panacisoli]QYJ02515.1 YihY/virulence factor BrkB family protein [Nocardioides panacisoli]